jgi:outer membrane protein OmpU
LTVAVGNINGAIDASAGVYSGSVGLTGLGYSNVIVGNYDGYSSTGGGTNGVEVIYAANGLNVHLSHGGTSERTALALGYTFGDWKVNLGVQDGATAAEDFTVLSADGTIGSASVGLAIADNNGVSAWRVNAGFEVGAGTKVTVFVADSDATTATDTAYGLGFTHSLGGATLAGGVVKSNTGQTKADLGVRFNF